MIRLTPTPDNHIRMQIAVNDEAGERILASEVMRDGGKQVIEYVTRKCCTKRADANLRATIYEINAVVMSEDDFQDLIRRAYMEGRHDAGRYRIGGKP